LKKKNRAAGRQKKLLLLRALAPSQPAPAVKESFLVFFKKEPLPSLLT
jgi:hypothetical protein